MAATKQDICRWLEEGKEREATHVIVVCDTFDWDDYPVYVMKDEDVDERYKHFNGNNMQKVMEVYKLSLPIEPQLAEHRAMNF
jgi:hypothetical protein